MGAAAPQGARASSAQVKQNRVVAFSLTVIEHPGDGSPCDVGIDTIVTNAARRFVLVHEKAERGWWLPGGGVDAGQTLAEAAVREAAEEAGCNIQLTGVLRIELSVSGRLRVLWHARPVDASVPLKATPDKESRGACWVTLEQMAQIGGRTAPGIEHCWLRGTEPADWFSYLCRNGPRALVSPVAPSDFVVSRRLGHPASEWGGDGDPPRAMYPTETSVRLVIVRTPAPDSGGMMFLGLGEPPSLPEAMRRPGQRLLDVGSNLIFGHEIEEVVGAARFEHEIDVQHADPAKHKAMIVLSIVATMAGDAASVSAGAWHRQEAFESNGELLERIAKGSVYPLSVISELEGAEPLDPDQCSGNVQKIERALRLAGARA